MAHLNRQKAYGRWESSRVDVGPVREHLTTLQDRGVGLRTVQQDTGIARTTLQRIVGRGRYVDRDVAATLLAYRGRLPDGAFVDATGTRRRLQALVAAGYLQSRLAERIGWSTTNVGALIHNRRWVKVATARLVADLFDELHMVPGPSSRARQQGLQNKWPLPLAWDEDTIDDPAAVPWTKEAERAERAARRRAEKARVV